MEGTGRRNSGQEPDMRSTRSSSSRANSDSKSAAFTLLSDSPVDHPLPLRIIQPLLRRSPRLATVPSVSDSDLHVLPSVLTTPELLHSDRRSPRLPQPEPGGSAPARNLTKILASAPKQCLRRSPRLQRGDSAAGAATSGVSPAALRDSLSIPPTKSATASEKLKRTLRICGPEMSLRRSPRFSRSADSAVDEASPEGERWPNKRSTFKFCEKKTMDLQHSENNKAIRRSPRISSHPYTTESSCQISVLPNTSREKSRFSLNGNSMPLSQEDSDSQTQLFRTPEEPQKWSKDDKLMPKQLMLLHQTCPDSLLRRSPRFTLPPQDNGGNKSLRKLNSRIAHVEQEQVRRSPRHSPLGGYTNIDLNSDIDIKRPSKKAKISSQSSTTTLDDEISKQSPEGSIDNIVKPEKQEDSHVSAVVLETTEKQNHLERKDSDSLGNRLRGQKINYFIGDPIGEDEARDMWGWRYQLKHQKPEVKSKSSVSDVEDEIVTDVKCHYKQAKVNGCIYSLGDCATIRGEGGKEHVGRILEFFRTTDEDDYFRVQWFYRAEDTVLQEQAANHNKKRLFYSKVENDNPVDCIIRKVKITRMNPKFGVNSSHKPPSDYYYDMEYCLEYSSFCSLPSDLSIQNAITSPPPNVEDVLATSPLLENKPSSATDKVELTLLDLFSGCGGMSTGLYLGAKLSSVNLVMRWSLDFDESACESMKLNHPETLVRNEAAEDFLQLLKEWEKLCKRYVVNKTKGTHLVRSRDHEVAQANKYSVNDVEVPNGEYEVGSLVDICYGDPSETGRRGLKFKVRWRGYCSDDDTWEPVEGLSKCQERIEDFVRTGYQSKILPLPGDVDVICGGPPCQGISGYNRFRNVDSPLDDERNRQIIVFMDIVQFLKPKFVLMENVTDILRLDNASLARYALSRLVHMRYQARLGTIAAGSYGLPQFRLRVFLWGAHPNEMLPQFPLPTHDVIVRYWPPPEFERNTVAYHEGQPRDLEKAAVLRDAITDLPEVTNHETREQIAYNKPPETELQRFLRSTKYEMTGYTVDKWTQTKRILYDHRPYAYLEDNFLRICQVPKRKGANFRDFPGLVVGNDNVVRRDETKEPILLPSGKPMVPDYAFTYEQGKSKRPFGRLWWDETMPTVLTFPDCRNQTTIHPEQDRVLTIRECARLQGFPDYYRFCGTIKERYCQIGNAVAVPVSRALGYSLGMASRKLSGSGPDMILPPKFSYSTYSQFTDFVSPPEAISSL